MGWHVPAANVAYYETTFDLDHYSVSLVQLWELTYKNKGGWSPQTDRKKKKGNCGFQCFVYTGLSGKENFI